MRKLLSIGGVIVFLVLAMSWDSEGEGRWVSNGPWGGCILTVAIDPQNPQTLYGRTWPGTWQGGVFKSTNSGASWNPVNTGLTDLDIRALAIDPQNPETLYAGTKPKAI